MARVMTAKEIDLLWDRIIEEQREAHGPVVHDMIRTAARAADYFTPDELEQTLNQTPNQIL